MTETAYVFRCRECRSYSQVPGSARLETADGPMPIAERTNDGNASTLSCPECGYVLYVTIDGGTLDLGLVRDEILPSDDYVVFG